MGCRVCGGTLEGLNSQHVHLSNLIEFEAWPGVYDRFQFWYWSKPNLVWSFCAIARKKFSERNPGSRAQGPDEYERMQERCTPEYKSPTLRSKGAVLHLCANKSTAIAPSPKCRCFSFVASKRI